MGQLYPPPPEIMEQIASHRRWLDSRGDDGHCIYLAFEDHEALDLRGAMLSEGMFQETNLSGSRLDGADLARIVGNGIRLAGASMVDAIAAKAELVGADLRGVDGQRAIFRNARLREARFDGAQLRGAHFTGADGIQASFRDADLRDTDFSGALLSAADTIPGPIADSQVGDVLGMFPSFSQLLTTSSVVGGSFLIAVKPLKGGVL